MEYKIYSAENLKNPIMIFQMILIFGITVFMIWIAFKADTILNYICALFCLCLFIMRILMLFTSKVILTDHSISKKVFFKKISLEFSEVKNFSVYEIRNKKVHFFNEQEILEDQFSNATFIFLANSKDYKPNLPKQKGCIRLQYSKELYSEIKINIKDVSS